MAKRFTDTNKWKRGWYLNLGARLRDLRQFILDDCDHAGIWDYSLKRLNFTLNDKFTEDDIKAAFKGKIQIIGDRIFIPDFLEFQYGALNVSNKVHASVLDRLKKCGFNLAPLQGAWEGAIQGAKDKEEEKDKDKEEDKEGVPALNLGDSTTSIYISPSAAKVPQFSSEVEIFKYAIKKFGNTHTLQAKAWLGESRWSTVGSLGGWPELCKMKWDDFTDQRIKRAIENR